ncbi:DegQ family serine endoprotease [Aureimonas leprariae]|uniref:Probable periplasmic serine endoprotease DegP-like n=1 Tax=Plantimonas leprariae TaxID=2615207 RepID=A0A7V7TXV1_9HYPH|nr:DegQ family serine endoprotease [Aureimonas leprariae]KAB0681926.1 Do family serine endopeptidase [Aureimonas leprariae]
MAGYSTRRSAVVLAMLLSAAGCGVAAGQGVIQPPPGNQPVAPQKPAADTINPTAPGVPPMPPVSRSKGPDSVADLAEGLLDAVVNISTAQKVEGSGPEDEGDAAPPLKAPEGSPLQDFFNDLLKDGQGGESRKVESLGSGFVIDPSGVIVTNNHVITDADEITANFADGSKLEAKLIGVDTKTDIAVLKVESPKPLKAVKFGDSEKMRIGDWVMAIGNPFGLGGSVSIGIVSARGRNINAGPYDNFIQTDAAINKGNSGGPLFDMNGDVVGINTAILSPTGGSIGLGFSIPSSLASNVVTQLRDFGETRRGWLGIRLQEVTDEIGEGLGLKDVKGALVMGVVPGGPSDNGSLKVGDVITAFDGKPITSSRDLPRIVAETPVGKNVDVKLLRKDNATAPAKEVDVKITLGRLEDGEKLMSESEKGSQTPGDGKAGSAAPEALGMTFSDLTDDLRKRFNLAAGAAGVVVTEVKPNSGAADKGIEPGLVIKEVAQESVSKAKDVADKLAKLKTDGRKNALLLLASANGELRFVVVPIE